jgi:uncharacterized protein YggT (Ycf19 family)
MALWYHGFMAKESVDMRFLIHAFIRYLKYVLGFAEILFTIRMMLRFLEANPQAIIVELLYRVTDALATPFRGIFPDLVLSNGSVIDLSTLSAMIGYPVIAYLVIVFLELVTRVSAPAA